MQSLKASKLNGMYLIISRFELDALRYHLKDLKEKKTSKMLNKNQWCTKAGGTPGATNLNVKKITHTFSSVSDL